MSEQDKKIDLILKKFDKVDEIHTSVEVIKNELGHLKTDVSKNTKDLEEHIAGVQTNQQRLNTEIQNREELEKSHQEVKDKVTKMEKVHIWLNVSAKVLGVLAVICGMLFGFLKFIWPLLLV